MHRERARGERVGFEEVLRRAVARQRDGVDADATARGAERDDVGDHRVADADLARAVFDEEVGDHAEALARAQGLDGDGRVPEARRRRWCRRRCTRRHDRAARGTTSSSGSGNASRSTQSGPPFIAPSSARSNRASSTIRGMSSAPAARLASTSAELRDLAEDRVARAVRGFVATDQLERVVIEALEALDHLRRRQLVVVGNREGVDVGRVGDRLAVARRREPVPARVPARSRSVPRRGAGSGVAVLARWPARCRCSATGADPRSRCRRHRARGRRRRPRHPSRRPTLPDAASFAKPTPLDAAPAAMPMLSSTFWRTSVGDGTGGGSGVRCDCTSRLPRATKIPSMLGIMSRTYIAAPMGA